MTIYFDKRAFEEQEKEQKEEDQRIKEELEKEIKNQEAVKAVAAVLGLFGKPLILMLLWNWLVPGIFGLATIGYLKAFGLYLLSRILFDKDD
tara:strand:- start:1220 stop:1495 length:276 start_codon:yes stop_codon:yes gene_type:complete